MIAAMLTIQQKPSVAQALLEVLCTMHNALGVSCHLAIVLPKIKPGKFQDVKHTLVLMNRHQE